MSDSTAPTPSPSPHHGADWKDLEHTIHHLAQLLPSQGPITAFAMLNPLEGLETEPFESGLERGSHLNGCEAYLPEEQYRMLLGAGRIDLDTLEAMLRSDLRDRADETLLSNLTRLQLRLALLQQTFPSGQADELSWVMAESDALDRCRPQLTSADRQAWVTRVRSWVLQDACQGRSSLAELLRILSSYGLHSIENWEDSTWETVGLRLLWAICLDGVARADRPESAGPQPVRHRDVLLARTGQDSDVRVLDVLGPFCAAFADQGLSRWSLPGREQGFLASYAALHSGRRASRWLADSELEQALRRVQRREVSALGLVEESLTALGVGDADREPFLTASLLAFRGWAGMLRQMEFRGDRVPIAAPGGTLVEFFAVQLLLERWSLAELVSEELDEPLTLPQVWELRRETADRLARRPEQWAYKLFQLTQTLGWDIAELARLSNAEWSSLIQEIADFPPPVRRRVFHAAYERHYIDRALNAFAFCSRRPLQRVSEPKLQAMFCIDAREESFRRHLEELDPQVETFGNAGFFNVPIYYRGAGETCYAALCPIVIRPQHWIVEEVALTLEEEHRRRSQIRKVLGNVSLGLHQGSRGLTAGAVLSAGLGTLASIPLITRILFPRLSSRLRRTVERLVEPPPITRLRLERTAVEPGPEGAAIGFNVGEMTAMGERALRDTGLTTDFAPLVFIFGHGSACLNNPHKSAYDCGACTGNAGGPNARALAMILNDPRVREELRRRGIIIPEGTAFIGGLHNTADDTLTYYDLDLLPPALAPSFRAARDLFGRVCEQNAHERCRRFYSAPLTITPQQAHRLVEDRTEDLAQTRPEYGNCTNAVCFVGRRARIRGLYLDRRAFQMSYDHTQDDALGTILGRILGAVVPVCSGINLQYTLSAMDPPGWGAGTKLPHNITSLLGVMDGAASDLRSGLPWQGVDIHEPMRLLFVIETTPERIGKVMSRNPVVDRILRNRWAHLALIDPGSGRIAEYRPRSAEPGCSPEEFSLRPEASADLPQVESSPDWYGGHREHLEFALIRSGRVATDAIAMGGGRA